ncbi:hypothetical protein, partial [Klebsiella pneumoniae]|uniref:hypothetical protein n=1 Tax=Klebsiella pneumoniae TaxID=573 RepID=UPI003CF20D2D
LLVILDVEQVERICSGSHGVLTRSRRQGLPGARPDARQYTRLCRIARKAGGTGDLLGRGQAALVIEDGIADPYPPQEVDHHRT